MSRRWMGIALLLSLGVNLGIVAVLLGERLWPTEDPVPTARQPASAARVGPGGEATERRPQDRERPFDRPTSGVRDEHDVPPAIARRLGGLADRLGLRDERRAQFVEIQHAFFGQTHERRNRIIELQERFRRELAAAEPSAAEIERLVQGLGEERTALEAAFAEAVLETRELLDPRQDRMYLEFVGRLRSGGPGARPGPPRRR